MLALTLKQSLEPLALLLQLLLTALILVAARTVEGLAELLELSASRRLVLNLVGELLHRVGGALRVGIAKGLRCGLRHRRPVQLTAELSEGLPHRFGVGLATLGETGLELLNSPQRFGAIEAAVGEVLQDLVERASRLAEIIVRLEILKHGIEGGLEALERVLIDEKRLELADDGHRGANRNLELSEEDDADAEHCGDAQLSGDS